MIDSRERDEIFLLKNPFVLRVDERFIVCHPVEYTAVGALEGAS
jgi:hypothetical protein